MAIELRSADLYTDQITGDKKLLLYFDEDKNRKIWLDLLIGESLIVLAQKLRWLAEEIDEVRNAN